MALLVASPVHAEGNNGQLSSQDLVISPDAVLYSINGKQATEELCQNLESYDIYVSDNTLIEVRPLLTNSAANVLIVTNEENGLMTKDVLIDIDENGQVQPIVITDNADVSLCGGSTIERPTGKTYSIKATAVYNQRTDSSLLSSYYQPIGAYFFYYNTGSSSVTYIKIEYSCDGFEYTYPGFTAINNSAEYEHMITVTKSSPATNTMYHTVNEYRSDRVICTISGSPMVGQYMGFTYTVNGTTKTHSVRIVD